MSNDNYSRYFHFNASSIPLRALDKIPNALFSGLLVIAVPLAGISKVFGLTTKVKEGDTLGIAYPSEVAFLADLARAATASSFVARKEVANGFSRFLDSKFGDLINIDTPEKDICSSSNITTSFDKRSPEGKPYQIRAMTFNIQLEEYSFINSSRLMIKDGEFDLQNAAIRDQLDKVTKLLGGKVDEYTSDGRTTYTYEIFSVADVQASKYKALAIKQMEAIDSNKDEIRAELQKLVELSKGETLADAIKQKREAAKVHEPEVTTARDALAARRARPKAAEPALA